MVVSLAVSEAVVSAGAAEVVVSTSTAVVVAAVVVSTAGRVFSLFAPHAVKAAITAVTAKQNIVFFIFSSDVFILLQVSMSLNLYNSRLYPSFSL